MALPIAVRVPVSFCVSSTLTEDHLAAGYVMINGREALDKQPRLQTSKMFTQVFANLTLGALIGQEGNQGFSKVLKLNDDHLARVVAACAKLKVSKHARPSPNQAVELAAILHIPTKYGEEAFHLVLSRVLGFIDRYISVDSIKNALECRAGKFVWKAHTRNWTPGITTLQNIREEVSTGLRKFEIPKTTLGIKRIVDQALEMKALAGDFDTPNARATSVQAQGHHRQSRAAQTFDLLASPSVEERLAPQTRLAAKTNKTSLKAPMMSAAGREATAESQESDSMSSGYSEVSDNESSSGKEKASVPAASNQPTQLAQQVGLMNRHFKEIDQQFLKMSRRMQDLEIGQKRFMKSNQRMMEKMEAITANLASLPFQNPQYGSFKEV